MTRGRCGEERTAFTTNTEFWGEGGEAIPQKLNGFSEPMS
jgi:hypothetical protein